MILFNAGIAFLLLALFLSAYMGIYQASYTYIALTASGRSTFDVFFSFRRRSTQHMENTHEKPCFIM